jgi:hypothetical protein
VVQELPSSHSGAAAATQAPAWQVSTPSQKSRSAQLVPFATGVCVQPPAGSQASAVHGLLSSHGAAALAVHAPYWQVGEAEQPLGSPQAVPLGRGSVMHVRRASSQNAFLQAVFCDWQLAVPPPQTPATQVSPTVQ